MHESGIRTRWIGATIALLFALAACQSSTHEDEAAIAAVMKQTWDKLEAPLAVGPIALDGDAAMAGWTQGSQGGRALLRRRDSRWTVVLCAGDGIKSEAALQSAGLSPAQAQRIAAQLTEKEKAVPTERLAAMTRFKGVIRMDSPADATTHASAAHGDSPHPLSR